jgi:hypothetical protein
MIGGTVANGVNAVFSQTETFESGAGYSTSRSFAVSLITLVIMLSLILLLGKFLWNNVLTALVPAVRPAKSIWQILGLAVLIGLMYPGYCC